MGKKIKLQTHDGSENYLEEIQGRPNQYKLVCEFYFLRGGNTPDGNKFIDPSGNPMIVKGSTLECYGDTTYKVENIHYDKEVGYHVITLSS